MTFSLPSPSWYLLNFLLFSWSAVVKNFKSMTQSFLQVILEINCSATYNNKITFLYDYKYYLSEPSLRRTFEYKTSTSAGSSFMYSTPLSSISTAVSCKYSLKVLNNELYYISNKFLKVVFVIV